jgi:predicted enzyme related to lactoylglutathione lyase
MTTTASFHHVKLTAESPERAPAVYEHVFDWECESPPDQRTVAGIVYFDAIPEVGLRLDGSAGDGGVRPAVKVRAIAATPAEVEGAGGWVIEAAVDVGFGNTGFLADTEDDVVGLWRSE